MEGWMRRVGPSAVFVVLGLLMAAAPAGAAVTIGQVAPTTPSAGCGGAVGSDQVQPTVKSGNSYVVPGTGTITSWSHNAAAGSGQQLTMKIFRKVADPATYLVVGHDGPRALAPGNLNGFPANIAVKPGDVIGLNDYSPAAPVGCSFSATGEGYVGRTGSLADGEFGSFTSFGAAGNRRNISAVFVPSNAFTFGKARRNETKGTATLKVDFPNLGEFTVGGKGLKAAAVSGATAARGVTAPGTIKLTIKAKGQNRHKLSETGKVQVKPKITYTPTGGDAATRSIKVKLKLR